MTQVRGLFSSQIKRSNACGYCHYHNCYMTVKQVKAHQCLQKQCNRLQKFEEHEWWNQRNRLKEKKKSNRQISELVW